MEDVEPHLADQLQSLRSSIKETPTRVEFEFLFAVGTSPQLAAVHQFVEFVKAFQMRDADPPRGPLGHFLEKGPQDKTLDKVFEGVILPCRHEESDRRFILLIRADENAAYLPKNGEVCDIQFHGMQAEQAEPADAQALELEQVDIMANQLMDVIRENEGSEPDVIIQETQRFMKRPLSLSEVTDFVSVHAEDEVKEEWTWIRRFQCYLTEQDLLPSTSPAKPDKGLWYHAQRCDIANAKLETKFQTYMVQKPLQKLAEDVQPMDTRRPIADNMEILRPDEQDGFNAFWDRVSADDKIIQFGIRQKFSDNAQGRGGCPKRAHCPDG